MDPFEAPYGRRFRSPIGWFEVSEASIIGPDLVFDALEKVQLIKERLWASKSRQKSYADVHRKDLEFEVAYELELPSDLASVHPVFHVSLLKKCIGDPAVVVPIQSINIHNSLSYEENPIEILDYQTRRLRNKKVPIVKVLWQNQSHEGATWEAEADMRAKYPHLFPANSDQAQGTDISHGLACGLSSDQLEHAPSKNTGVESALKCYFDIKKSEFRFQDQDSTSTLSTSQSNHIETTMGKSKTVLQNFIAPPGWGGILDMQAESGTKASLSGKSATNTLPQPQVHHDHPTACLSYP
ncbi:hypothetical protein FXO38_07899 [Capsicum annuum]|nr:hypothetical protein FXO38_07899 [Capsicum annuum]